MKDHVTIEGHDGAFAAYIARPKTSPAPAVVVPFSCIWPKRTSSFPSLRKLRLKRHLPRNQTPRSTAIRVRIMRSLGIMAHTTMPPRQRSPTGGQANFYINNCGEEIRDDKKNRDGAVQPDHFQAV
jgi:hypothetical protein